MKASNRNHIYKYDRERQKVIIINSETGKEVKRSDDQLTALLKYVREQGANHVLRKFAIWCARQPNVDWKPVVYKMFRTAEDYLHDEITKEKMNEFYQETEGIAVSTDSVGLRQGDLKAPLLLAARSCLHPDPYQAATESARYHKLWVEMDYKFRNDDLSEDDAEEVNRTMLDKVTQRQIDHLLDLMARDMELGDS